MKNQYIINAIITLLEGYHNTQALGSGYSDDIQSLNYLIGQLIRQYDIDTNNMHVSQEANCLWNQLTSESINTKWFRDSVKCDRLQKAMKLRRYKGSDRNGKIKTFRKNDPLCFNDVFHVDHIVPVSLIKKELLALNNPDINSVESILAKMHLCRILKEEDRKIGRTTGRTTDWQETMCNVYNPAGIDLV